MKEKFKKLRNNKKAIRTLSIVTAVCCVLLVCSLFVFSGSSKTTAAKNGIASGQTVTNEKEDKTDTANKESIEKNSGNIGKTDPSAEKEENTEKEEETTVKPGTSESTGTGHSAASSTPSGSTDRETASSSASQSGQSMSEPEETYTEQQSEPASSKKPSGSTSAHIVTSDDSHTSSSASGAEKKPSNSTGTFGSSTAPSASSSNTETKPETETEPEVKPSAQPTHEHVWEMDTDYIHHEEVGHWQTTEAWDEPVYEERVYLKCRRCGLDMTNFTPAEIREHTAYCGGVGSNYGEVFEWEQVDTIHHPAESVWVVDEEAWDEKVVNGWRCTICGEKR